MEKHGIQEKKLTAFELSQQRQEEMVRSTLGLTADLALIQRGRLEGASSGLKSEDQKNLDRMKRRSREARNSTKGPPPRKKPGKLGRYLDNLLQSCRRHLDYQGLGVARKRGKWMVVS
jgi:hypothetical protein